MPETDTGRWLAQARELQERVRAAHRRALKEASNRERKAADTLQEARADLQRAAQVAHESGMTEREIADAMSRSPAAAHFAVTAGAATSASGGPPSDPGRTRKSKKS